VRVLKGSTVVYEAPTAAAPVRLKFVAASHDPTNRFPNAKEVLYGTDTGE
jgi:Bardet-Biedl syndrome 7 protein